MLVQSPWWIEKNAHRVWFVFGRFGWEGCVPEITMRWKNCQDWDTSLELKNPNQQTCPIWGDIHRSRSDKLRDSWPDAYVCVGQNWMPNLEESLHLTARVWRMLRSQHSGTDPKLRNMRVTVTPTGLSCNFGGILLRHFAILWNTILYLRDKDWVESELCVMRSCFEEPASGDEKLLKS